ncbi:hypothetical protein CMUS01_14940 [Colletotrichum musicola]|uniref:Uncharacterized protein n=1 Tax=Colletotrichum musicola TaxID=2175873 RepID=A0A8H6J0T2_9PEZI|nr:hypothetical protein CMUS01_14940 [Colletotrichum musicola]
MAGSSSSQSTGSSRSREVSMRIQLDLPAEDGTSTRRIVYDGMFLGEAQVFVGVVGFFSGNNSSTSSSRRKRGRTAESTGGSSATNTGSDVDMPDAPPKTPSPEGSPAPKG